MVEIMENKIIMQNEVVFCKRCHRKLKDPEHKRLGYGKICYEKVKKDNTNYLFRIEGDKICLNS